jgi:hypothetical protein
MGNLGQYVIYRGIVISMLERGAHLTKGDATGMCFIVPAGSAADDHEWLKKVRDMVKAAFDVPLKIGRV